MRKVLMVLASLLIVAGSASAPAYANDSDTDVIACAGGAGYSGGTWQFFSSLGGTGPSDSKCVMVSSDVDATPISLQLSGTGNFACGFGSLSGTGSDSLFASSTPIVGTEPTYSLSWQATIAHGVGAIAGTATADCSGEGGAECGQVKTLGGYIVVVDGAPLPGQCNDSLGSSQVIIALTISP